MARIKTMASPVGGSVKMPKFVRRPGMEGGAVKPVKIPSSAGVGLTGAKKRKKNSY